MLAPNASMNHANWEQCFPLLPVIQKEIFNDRVTINARIFMTSSMPRNA